MLSGASENAPRVERSHAKANWGVKRILYEAQTVEEHEFWNSSVYDTGDIYVEDGTSLRSIRHAKVGQAPAWSADGEKIAFIGNSDKGLTAHPQIQLMSFYGSDRTTLTNAEMGVVDFVWSPVEEKIAYCKVTEDWRAMIAVVNADESERKRFVGMGPG